MVIQGNDPDSRYELRVLDTSGNCALDMGTDFSCSRADFAGNNVLLYSYNECLVYSFAGVEKFYQEFDQHIEALKSADGKNFVLGTNASTEFLTLK